MLDELIRSFTAVLMSLTLKYRQTNGDLNTVTDFIADVKKETQRYHEKVSRVVSEQPHLKKEAVAVANAIELMAVNEMMRAFKSGKVDFAPVTKEPSSVQQTETRLKEPSALARHVRRVANISAGQRQAGKSHNR